MKTSFLASILGRFAIVLALASAASAFGQYRGEFVKHVVTVSWAGDCDRPGLSSTNVYEQPSISVPLNRQAPGCTNFGISLQGTLNVSFPAQTPYGTIDFLRFIRFTNAMQRGASFTGQWQFSATPPANKWELIHYLDLGDPPIVCAPAGQTNGPGISGGTPISLRQDCGKDFIRFGGTNGTDLIYSITTHLSAFIYVAAPFPPDSRILFHLSVDVQTTYRVPTAPLARLVGLEVVQVIQDWKNSVPLIAQKKTTVRAHFQSLSDRIVPVTVKLRGFRGNTEILPALNPLNPGGSILARPAAEDQAALRAMFNSSLNYSLPSDWTTGTVTLRLETNIVVACAEAAGTPNDCAVTVSFRPMPALPINWVYLSWTNRDDAGTIITNTPPANQPAVFAERLIAIYPITRLTTNLSSAFWSRANGAPTTTTSDDANEGRLNAYLTGLRTASRAPAAGGPIWYGMVPNTFVRGQASLPGYVAHGSDDIPAQYNLVAHELGHSLDRNHAAHSTLGQSTNYVTNVVGTTTIIVTNIWKTGRCDEWATNTAPDFPMLPHGGSLAPVLGPTAPANDMIFGYDHHQQLVISPTETFDIMSYCNTGYSKPIPGSTSFQWMSFYNYTNVMNAIINRWGGGGAPPPAPPAVGGEFLIVRGMLNEARGIFNLLPLYTVPFDVGPELPQPGPYLIRLLDVNGVVLSEVPFSPVFGVSEFNPITDDPTLPFEGHFNVPVASPAGLARIEIRHNGQLLGARNATANPPIVQVTRPVGGEQFGPGQLLVQWTASDADGNPLTHMVQYSRDNGVTWETVVLDHETTSLTMDQQFLMAAPQARFRVIASDGFRSARADTAGTFTVQNHPPIAEIRTPHQGDLLFGNQTIVFEASAFDLDDGFLQGTNVQWRSSRDGLLGTGQTLLREAGSLSEGAHLITVTATDSGGQTRSAQVDVVVMRAVPSNIADLAVTQTSETSGDGLVFTVTVENRGPSDATGLRVTNTLPAGLSVVSATSTAGPCTVTNGLVICSIASLPSGKAAVITATLAGAMSGGYTNLVAVGGAQLDPTPHNNQSETVAQFTVALPQLLVERANNAITISWPATTQTNFVLQSSLSLSPPVWSDVLDAPTVADGRFRVGQTGGSTSRYYRLFRR